METQCTDNVDAITTEEINFLLSILIISLRYTDSLQRPRNPITNIEIPLDVIREIEGWNCYSFIIKR